MGVRTSSPMNNPSEDSNYGGKFSSATRLQSKGGQASNDAANAELDRIRKKEALIKREEESREQAVKRAERLREAIRKASEDGEQAIMAIPPVDGTMECGVTSTTNVEDSDYQGVASTANDTPVTTKSRANHSDEVLLDKGAINALEAAKFRLKTLSIVVDTDTGHKVFVDEDREVMREDTRARKLYVPIDPSDDDILVMLLAAQERYGSEFTLFGTPDFVSRCESIAAEHEIKHQVKTHRKSAPK